jgi:hypothetical protein
MELSRTIRSLETDITKKRASTKIYARVVWLIGLILLICAASCFLVFFIRLLNVSQKAG